MNNSLDMIYKKNSQFCIILLHILFILNLFIYICFIGHFAERPLPSSGAISFLRGFACELQRNCSQTPRTAYYSDELLKLTNLSTDILDFLKQPDIISTTQTFIDFVQFIQDRRVQANVISSNSPLSESLANGEAAFQTSLVGLSLFSPDLIDNDILQSI